VPLLKQYGYLRVGSLEVQPQAVTADLANALNVPQTGLLMTRINPEGPAAGKLQLGDIVLKVAGEEVREPRDLYRRIGSALGQTVPLLVWRKGQIMTIEVVPVQSPQEAGQPPKEMLRPVAQASETMRLGVEVAPLMSENRKQFDLSANQTGIVVTKVLPDSPGAAAGLSVGDVIESVQMESVNSPAEAARILDKAKAEGRQFVVSLVRGSKDSRFVTVPISADQ